LSHCRTMRLARAWALLLKRTWATPALLSAPAGKVASTRASRAIGNWTFVTGREDEISRLHQYYNLGVKRLPAGQPAWRWSISVTGLCRWPAK